MTKNSRPLSSTSRTFGHKFIAGFGVAVVLFVAFIMALASPANPHDATVPPQIARAISPDSIDPLARLNRRLPGQSNTALASLVNMEGFSPESSKFMLAGFGGGGQAQQTTTVDYIYDGQNMIRTLKNGGPGATYLTGPSGPVYRRDDVTGAVRWYLYDGTNNVIGEVDPSGNITSSRKLDVFGNMRGGNNPAGTSKHKFQGGLGHLSEDETGLAYMKARYFDPVTGRFLSQDPAQYGRNWFAYASNNPINRFDPTGRSDYEDQAAANMANAELGVCEGNANAAFLKLAGKVDVWNQAYQTGLRALIFAEDNGLMTSEQLGAMRINLQFFENQTNIGNAALDILYNLIK